MDRQRVLTRAHPLPYTVVLDEAALRRSVGDREAMRAQFARLVDLDRHDTNVQISSGRRSRTSGRSASSKVP